MRKKTNKLTPTKRIVDYFVKVEKLRDAAKIQNSPGNFDVDEYMRGMANGLIFALSIFDNVEPVYHPAPVKEANDQSKT